MLSSNPMDAVSAALVQAQAVMEAVAKEAVNPTFNSRYATLDDVTNAALKACRAHDLAILQGTEAEDEAGVSVVTTLLHSTGQWISTRVRVPLEMQRRKDGTAELTAQKASSAITYGRRVGLAAFFAIVSETDDDGEEASKGGAAVAVHAPQRHAAAHTSRQAPPDRTQQAIDRVAAMAGGNGGSSDPRAEIPMPGKAGMHFKDRSKRAWAGEPIGTVPGPVLAEALEWLSQKATDPTNKYADRTRADVQLLVDESNRRLGNSVGTSVRQAQAGPGRDDSFDDMPEPLQEDDGDDSLPF